MKEPCRSCPEQDDDLGGCRCQAYMMTGDPYAADPVCSKSPDRHHVDQAIASAENLPKPNPQEHKLVFRDPKASSKLSEGRDGAAILLKR